MEYDKDYYYIPKVLFQDDFYKGLSVDAIFIYTILRDRQKDAISKKWIDTDGNVYLAYSLPELQKMFGFGKDKMIEIMRKLEEHNLIEREREYAGFYGHNFPYRTYIIEV